MTVRMKIIAATIGVVIFISILELVRRRKLREEYSWLWLITGMSIVVLALWYDLLAGISRYIGGVWPSSVLFFFGLIFLLLISLYQSVKISRLTDQVQELSQELAIRQVKVQDEGGPVNVYRE